MILARRSLTAIVGRRQGLATATVTPDVQRMVGHPNPTWHSLRSLSSAPPAGGGMQDRWRAWPQQNPGDDDDDDDDQEETDDQKGARSVRRLYQKAGHFASLEDLARHLRNNIVYYDPPCPDEDDRPPPEAAEAVQRDPHGLMALNKPYGVPLRRTDDAAFCLEDALPLLKEVMALPHLEIVRLPERFTTGLLLLGTQKTTGERVKKCLRRCSSKNLLQDRHLVLTHAFPRLSDTLETVDVHMKKIGDVDDTIGKEHKEPVIVRTLASKKSLLKPELQIRRRHVRMQVLSRSGLAGLSSLVSLEATSTHQHFLQTYMSDLLSPVLGDNLYGYRVRKVMGVMTRIKPEAAPPGGRHQQNLPESLLERLGLSLDEESLLPKHVHLLRTHLPSYFGPGKHLTLYAPPPKFFRKTADRMKLKMNVKKIFEEDKVTDWNIAKKEERRKEKEEKMKEHELAATHMGEEK